METEGKGKGRCVCLGGGNYSIRLRQKELNNFCPQTDSTTFAFASVSILLLMVTYLEYRLGKAVHGVPQQEQQVYRGVQVFTNKLRNLANTVLLPGLWWHSPVTLLQGGGGQEQRDGWKLRGLFQHGGWSF